MDFSNYDSGEWLEIPRDVNGKPDPIKLKLVWMSLRETMTFRETDRSEKGLAESLDHISRHIVDWNLESNGQKIPCTKESKDRYVEALIAIKVKNAAGEDSTVGREMVAFAANPENYTKN